MYKLKIKKGPRGLVFLTIFLTFSIGLLESLGAPHAITYIFDITTVVMLFFLLGKRDALNNKTVLFQLILFVFGTNLRKFRESIGVSQEKFADMCGLHRTYISDIERFQRSISLNNVQKIADALGVETYKLFVETEDK